MLFSELRVAAGRLGDDAGQTQRGGVRGGVDVQRVVGKLREVDVGEDVIHIDVEHILLLDLARRGLRRERALHDGFLELLEPRVARDGARLLAHELHAVPYTHLTLPTNLRVPSSVAARITNKQK